RARGGPIRDAPARDRPTWRTACARRVARGRHRPGQMACPAIGPASPRVLSAAEGAAKANSDTAFVAGPVGLPELALEELAGTVAGKVGVEGDGARELEVRQAAAAEGDQLVGGGRVAGPELDGGVDALAPLGVGHPEHRRVEDSGMTMHHVLDLRRVDVHAAG